MNLLAFDTSSEMISFACMRNNRIIYQYNRRKKHGASTLIVRLKGALKRHRFSVPDFDAFVVGAGPGSFTGLRISFAIAKALSMSARKPLISFSSFLACAWQLPPDSTKVAVVTDARRKLVYGALFKRRNGILVQERREKLYTLDTFCNEYPEYYCITYNEWIKETLKKHAVRTHPVCIWPKATALLSIAAGCYNKKKFKKLSNLEPRYVYPKDCQVKKISS